MIIHPVLDGFADKLETSCPHSEIHPRVGASLSSPAGKVEVS